ncbi:MAG: hypothetical protein AB3N20_07025 [Rhizobiaceae bacterium]
MTYDIKTKGDLITGVVEEGRTWILARDGLFRRDGKYFISSHRLWEENEGYGCEENIRDKDDAEYDLPDFLSMLAKARAYFKTNESDINA